MDQKAKKSLFIGVIIFLLLFVGALVLQLTHKSGGVKKAPVTNLNSGTYYDKNSGQTYSNPVGKTPETYNTTGGQPTYLGFSNLLDYGLSDSQLSTLEAAFYSFVQQQHLSTKAISITVASISSSSVDPNTGNSTLSFYVVFDQKTTYKAQVQYGGLSSVELVLLDAKTSVQIYDSGTLGSG